MQLNALVANDGKLLQLIRAQQNSLRLVGIVPTWQAFKESEQYWEWLKAGFTQIEARKYQAWWEMLFELPRDRQDKASIILAIQMLVAEKARRSYGKTLTITPPADMPAEHVKKVMDYALARYEALNPV